MKDFTGEDFITWQERMGLNISQTSRLLGVDWQTVQRWRKKPKLSYLLLVFCSVYEKEIETPLITEEGYFTENKANARHGKRHKANASSEVLRNAPAKIRVDPDEDYIPQTPFASYFIRK